MKTHGLSKHPLYTTYKGMMARCYNRKAPMYHLYGGRGIEVCSRWRANPAQFIADMWPTYQVGLSLDRIFQNGNYSPDNCRWASLSEQMNNRRDNNNLTYSGVTLSLSAWARITGIPASTLKSRKGFGWDTQRILGGGLLSIASDEQGRAAA